MCGIRIFGFVGVQEMSLAARRSGMLDAGLLLVSFTGEVRSTAVDGSFLLVFKRLIYIGDVETRWKKTPFQGCFGAFSFLLPLG